MRGIYPNNIEREKMMDGYNHKEYIDLINILEIKTIMELGSRFGNESLELRDIFTNATIHAFECNPYVLPIIREKLKNQNNIHLHEIAVSDKNMKECIFYPATNNPGASSLFVATLGKWWGDYPPVKIETQRLDTYFKNNNISGIDLICADIQGGELGAFIGMGEYFKTVKYIITEIPTGAETYKGAPNRDKLLEFLFNNNFKILFQSPIEENTLEHNILFGRKDSRL